MGRWVLGMLALFLLGYLAGGAALVWGLVILAAALLPFVLAWRFGVVLFRFGGRL